MRILLPKGQQSKFIGKVISKISVLEAAKLCGLSERTIRDWRREKFLMEKSAMILLSERTNTPIPDNFKEQDDYWYSKSGSNKGMLAALKKYGYVGGDPDYRKEKWRQWWDNEGKFKHYNPLFVRKPVNRPRKSVELAEFFGIMLGDGGITNIGQQIKITLNSRDDKEYIEFVCSLIEKLFHRKPGISARKNAIASTIYVSSMDLVDYLVKLGLKTGNKVKLQVDIPDWIKNNKAYSLACVRGLVDTDGCVFNHTYKVNNEYYLYKKLAFTSLSVPMRKSVYDILKSIGIKPRIFGYRDVRIDSQSEVEKYFKVIGSSNQKHLNKYHK